jgi:hypothetical protein
MVGNTENSTRLLGNNRGGRKEGRNERQSWLKGNQYWPTVIPMRKRETTPSKKNERYEGGGNGLIRDLYRSNTVLCMSPEKLLTTNFIYVGSIAAARAR